MVHSIQVLVLVCCFVSVFCCSYVAPCNMCAASDARSVADDRKARSAGAAAAVEPPEILLEKLGFPRKRHYQKVESLSGGERRRLHLAAVLAEAPNILLLDEPTNDLDLATVEKLEEMLKVCPCNTCCTALP